MSSFTIIQNARAVVTEDGVVAQHRSASPEYQVVDPDWLAEDVARRYQNVTVKRVSKWAKVLEFRDRFTDEYDGFFRVLFTNDGKHSIKGCAGALRLACCNQFYRPVFRLHHEAPEVGDLVRDPAKYLEEHLVSAQAEILWKLDRLREVEPREDWYDFLDRGMPRLGRQATGYLQHKYDGGSMWDILQALTEIHRPGPQRLVTEALGDAWEGTARGLLVPSASLALGRRDAAALN